MIRLIPTIFVFWLVTGIGWHNYPQPLNLYEQPSALMGSISQVQAQSSNLNPAMETIVGPVRVRVPAIGLDTDIMDVDLTPQGIVDTPNTEVGWYKRSARLDETGAVVLSGHFIGLGGEKGVFYKLSELKKGERIEVQGSDKRVYTYEVYETELVRTSDFPIKKVYGRKKEPLLHLITCAGSYDSSIGTYSHRTLVYAKRIQ